jgi:hypothetical protein
MKGVVRTHLHAFSTTDTTLEELSFLERAGWSNDLGVVVSIRPVPDPKPGDPHRCKAGARQHGSPVQVGKLLHSFQRRQKLEMDHIFWASRFAVEAQVTLRTLVLHPTLRVIGTLTVN